MKALIGNAFLIGLAVAAASVAACSSGSSTSGHPSTASSTEDGTGSIGLQLTLPGGGVINTISYTVNGPNGAATIVTTGTVPVANSTSIFFQTPDNIPPGSGYTITLTGSDDAGDTCLGTSVPFTVTARTSTPVLVQLQCHGTASGNGSGTVTAVTSNCATWQSVGPATSDIVTGVADPVAFSATGPDHGNLSFTATVSGAGAATISPASGALTTGSSNTGSFNVTCTSAGLVNVTVVFADGPLPTGGSCDTTLDTVSFPIQCEGQSIVVDSGIVDSSAPVDTGVPDTGVADTGVKDTGVDTGVDSGSPFTAICNKATGNTTGCTPTELAFVEHDPSGVCINCLVQGGALDDSIFPDTGHECGDLTGAAEAACLATLDCILNTNVGMDNGGDTTSPTAPTCADKGNVSDCYCGMGVNTAACAALTAAPTGQCTAVEAAGLGPLPTFPTTPVLNAFTNVTLGSGKANQIFVTAQQNTCTSCF
jgi:hypothetical protein